MSINVIPRKIAEGIADLNSEVNIIKIDGL
jgi:hypothetical protein